MLISQPAVRPLSWRTDFDQADGELPAADWTYMFDNPKVRVIGGQAHAGKVDYGTGRQAAGWVRSTHQTATDEYSIRTQIVAPTHLATDNFTTIYCGASPVLSRMISLSMSIGSGSEVYMSLGVPNGPGGTIGGSNQHTLISIGNMLIGDDVELRRFGWEITVLVNGEEFGSFTEDAGTRIDRGPERHYWGFGLEANYPFLQQQYSSPGLEYIECVDLT